jgi:hypothetical protein
MRNTMRALAVVALAGCGHVYTTDGGVTWDEDPCAVGHRDCLKGKETVFPCYESATKFCKPSAACIADPNCKARTEARAIAYWQDRAKARASTYKPAAPIDIIGSGAYPPLAPSAPTVIIIPAR